jgi:hypothetical protein
VTIEFGKLLLKLFQDCLSGGMSKEARHERAKEGIVGKGVETVQHVKTVLL